MTPDKAAREFCRWAVAEMFDGFGDLDGGSVWEKMVELGLIVPVKGGYNPKIHGPDHYGDGTPGQDWYVYARWLRRNVGATGSPEPLNPETAVTEDAEDGASREHP